MSQACGQRKYWLLSITVAVYSEPDASSRHVKEADEAYCIGPERETGSYLNIRKILAKAMVSYAE